MHSEFLPLMLITLLAVLVPVLSSRLRHIRLPIVVGEILAGMIIGRSGLNLVTPSPTLTFLAEFGFVFLMFLSGLEIRLDALGMRAESSEKSSRWKQPFPLALLSFLLTVSLAIAIGFALSQAGLARSPVLMGLIPQHHISRNCRAHPQRAPDDRYTLRPAAAGRRPAQ